jgi:radical SAM protein with 4Fe4S-binding SPASM domain
MQEISSRDYFVGLQNNEKSTPLKGLIELTYRCNLNCTHCYCKGSEDQNRELTTCQWQKIIDQVRKEGCVHLLFSGGEPLLREDFLELYSYAREKGFLITIFTNGTTFTKEIISYLRKSPPLVIEITLNGITRATYEAITGNNHAFEKVIKNIVKLEESGLPLILKTNLLKENKHEIEKIKAFADMLLRKEKDKFHFKYDQMIYPRLNGDKTPCEHRLSFEELQEVKVQDQDIWQQYQMSLRSELIDFKRDPSFLYHCNAWKKQFFINPYGRLKFCEYSDKFSVDLRTTSFREGFYKVFPRLLQERFRRESKCRSCTLRPLCYYCPVRSRLETGDEEGPVEYYCTLAQRLSEQIEIAHTASERSIYRSETTLLR